MMIDRKPVAVNTSGMVPLLCFGVTYEADTYMVTAAWEPALMTDDGEYLGETHLNKVYTTKGGRNYIVSYGHRYHVDEFMRL